MSRDSKGYPNLRLLVAIGVGAGLWLQAGPGLAVERPHWIWRSPRADGEARPETNCFRKVFQTPPLVWMAVLQVAADDEVQVFLNGKEVARTDSWERPVRVEVAVDLIQGRNLMAVRAANREGSKGVLIRLQMRGVEQERVLVTDETWRAAAEEMPGWKEVDFEDAAWTSAVSLGALGCAPWGEVFQHPAATPAAALRVAPGFQVELLRSAEPEEGSWICLAVDDRGRLIISPEDEDQPLLRVQLATEGTIQRIEPVPAPVRSAMGLLFAYDSLYVNGHGPQGTGLYRLIDRNANDRFDADEVHLLKEFRGEGEHGYHAVAAGPDGMLYVLNGNGTSLPRGLASTSPYRHYSGDMVPLQPIRKGAKPYPLSAPGGHVLRTDPDGEDWELLLAGFRNPYDFAISAEGEIFTFDSDMEWDWGAPWYRPTRIFHCVSGGEYGWREWIHKWPPDYPDVLPPALDVGIGSPTGMKFGTRSHFPETYRQALFVQDWSYGRILAVHLQSQGASYTATFESFLEGRPLNLTDLEFGADGAMYFITGGRGTQSGLYRVSALSPQPWTTQRLPPPPGTGSEREAEQARRLRRQLEAWHRRVQPGAIDSIWPHLGSPDRWIRFAARVALERQPLHQWQERALQEPRVDTALSALLALARLGPEDLQPRLLRALAQLQPDTMNSAQKLAWLRAFQISLCRQGWPGPDSAHQAISVLNPLYPDRAWPINRELARLLVHLQAPDVVGKTLALLDTAPTQEQQIHYLALLRNLRGGWTLDQRKTYFQWWRRDRGALPRSPLLASWFQDVDRRYVDGAHLHLILEEFREQAVNSLTEADRSQLAPWLTPPSIEPQWAASLDREFVREWTVADLVRDLDRVARGRSFESGRKAFLDAQCLTCHRFGGAGGAVGPELDGVGKKYTARDILESILEPSRVVSEQYQSTTFLMKDRDEISGMVLGENEDTVSVLVSPLTQTKQQLIKADIAERRASAFSPMPEGLISILTREEILDLLAYLLSSGDPEAPCFRAGDAAP